VVKTAEGEPASPRGGRFGDQSHAQQSVDLRRTRRPGPWRRSDRRGPAAKQRGEEWQIALARHSDRRDHV